MSSESHVLNEAYSRIGAQVILACQEFGIDLDTVDIDAVRKIVVDEYRNHKVDAEIDWESIVVRQCSSE